MGRFLAAASLACFVVACSSSPTNPTVEPASEFVLAPGDSAAVSGTGLTVGFERVVNDSRCPADALCVTAGDAEVALTVRRTARPADGLSLHTGESRNRVEIGDWLLSLTRLAPYPFSDRTIAPGDYRATLRIDPARAAAGASS